MIITDHPEVDWVATSFHWATTTISWFNNLAPLSVKTVWLKVKCFGKTLISVQPVKAAARERLELLIFPEISNQTDHLACELRRCTPIPGPCGRLLYTFTVNYKKKRKKKFLLTRNIVTLNEQQHDLMQYSFYSENSFERFKFQ